MVASRRKAPPPPPDLSAGAGSPKPSQHGQLLEALRLNTEAQNRLAAGIEVQAMALHALADAIAVAASEEPDGEPERADVPRYMDGTPMPRGSTG